MKACTTLLLLALAAPDRTQPADVVVVGAGIAGLTTALEAARGGAVVEVIDLASVFGGHAVVAEGGLSIVDSPLQRSLGVQDSPDVAYDDFLRWGEDANAAWVRIYVNRSRNDLYDFMTRLGVRFEGLLLFPGNSVPRFHTNPRRGFGVVEPVFRECLKTGRVRFRWNARVTKLITDSGRATGVECVNERTGDRARVDAPAVVIATGGFNSNLELVRKHWPRESPLPRRMLAGGGINAMGSGLELAAAAGALIERLDHQWNYANGIPDPRFPGANRGLNFINPASVWVNSLGMRFVNENASSSELLRRLGAQPEGKAWMIFDSVGRKSLLVSGTYWADPKRVDEMILDNPALVHKAATWQELARLAGIPEQGLAQALRTFAEQLTIGVDPDFDRFNRSNPPTARVGRAPIPPVAVPPFYAVPIFPMTRKSMGGIAVDLECRVLDSRRRPIPGLYAAGEVTGFNGLNGKAGLEGTFIGPSILQGRILGQRLATEVKKSLPASRPDARTAPTTAGKSLPCESCHPIASLASKPRKGYWHFERVHAQVLERQWRCQTCHSEMEPFEASRHKTDPLAQTSACARCHLGEAKQ